MKKEEVPQDKSFFKEEHGKELCYAVDDQGNYTTALSSGWEAKTIALNNALSVIEERIADAKQRVLENKTSPIEYYMEVCKMELPILASYVGMWQWRVKRHFKPSVFKKLSQKALQKYAEVFDISVEQLKNIELTDS